MVGGAAIALAIIVAVVRVFSSSQIPSEARVLMVELLRWITPFFLFDAWQIVYVHALRGLRRTVLPMFLSTGCYWLVGLGGGVALASVAGLGALGVWVGFCTGLTCAAGLLATLAFQSTRRESQGT